MPQSPPERVRAWRALMHVHSSVTAAMDKTLRSEVGIPVSWYEALVEVAFAGGTMRMNEFADETTLTRSGATRFVDRLEREGLVRRVPCPTDRRVYNLELTGKGRRVQKAADPHVLKVVDQLFGSHLTDGETSTILEALTRVRTGTATV